MSEFELISPLLDGMVLEAALSTHGGNAVYRVLHQTSGVRYIVKRISIPASKEHTQALVLTGAVTDEAGADAYYRTVLQRYRDDLAVFRKLSGSPYLAGYLRFQIEQKTDRPGYDLYLLSPCRTSLRTFLQQNAITQQKTVQLGTDLCHSLQLLRENGYIYQNLKPENVFLEDGKFCIGDFGLYPISDLTYGSQPPDYVGRFTAPELCGLAGTLNLTGDLYAVGLLLYYIYNGNHTPFEEAGTTDKTADGRRIAGESLPTPLYADYEMDEIIRKACALKPEDRYQTPEELLAALQSYLDRNEVADTCLVPPLCTDDVPVAPPEETEAVPLAFADVQTLPDAFKESFTPAPEPDTDPPKRRRRKRWIPIVLILLLLLGAGGCYYVFEYAAITVQSVEITDKGTDYLTVDVSASDVSNLVVTCTAEDDSSSATYQCAETVTFRDLTPGVVYRVTVSSPDWHRVKGATETAGATASVTEILSFTAEDLSGGAARLTFQVSGPEPKSWTLHSQSDAAGEADYVVENHTCTVENLLPNSVYTFSLTAGDGYYLGGADSISYSYALPMEGSNLALKGTTDSTITVTWESDVDTPTEWTAVCSGDNGYASTLVTDQMEATFEGTATNVEYTITVSNSTMAIPLILTVQSTSSQVTDFTASVLDDAASLSWSAEGSRIPGTWVVTYGPVGTLSPATAETNTLSLELAGLIPGATYEFALSAKDESMVGGQTTVTADTPAAELYPADDYGGIYIGLYEAVSSWTIQTLGSVQESFAPGTPIVCAIEPTTIPEAQKTSGDEVAVMLVIRDSSGAPVSDSRETMTFQDIWQQNVFAAEISKTPTVAGSYKLELYFGGKLLRSTEFSVS
ncbi:MAG: protein kinase [Oscillospiraceae bacterium]|nr:protein kinase [Oscillospiraceae bacterium]